MTEPSLTGIKLDGQRTVQSRVALISTETGIVYNMMHFEKVSKFGLLQVATTTGVVVGSCYSNSEEISLVNS